MSEHQPGILAWQPPENILLFPLTSRIGKIRHTAKKLAGKQGEEADLYWKQVTAANRKHLARVGISGDEIDRQLRDFFDAVQAELVRISYFDCSNGGAA